MKQSINKMIAVWMSPVLLAACAQAKTVEAPVPQAEAALVTPTPAAQEAAAPQKPVAKAYVPSPDEVLERLKAWDKNLLFLQTAFTQVTSYDGVEINRSAGNLFYDKEKHLLRLDTQDTSGTLVQSAITDKKDLFILDDKGKQVMKLSWDEWQQNQPNQALFDFGNYTALLERHHVKAVRPNHFALTPKAGEEYTLYVTLSPQDYFPQTLQLVSGDISTQAVLTRTQKNQPLPKNTFGGMFK